MSWGVIRCPAYLGERFRAYSRLPLLKRLPQVVQDAKDYLKARCRYAPAAAEGKQLAEAVKGMLRITRLPDLYKDFYAWLGRPELLRPLRGSVLEYADVFPLVYLKMRLEGVAPYGAVKHLVVDEMQDYTPVQYAVLARLFPGKKTILGDASQAVNPYGATTADDIARVFPRAEIVRLNKSYRSTCEITAFAGRILPNPDLVAVERHGPEPAVRGFETTAAELDAIREMLHAFRASGRKSLGIICKTEGQAAALHGQLQPPGGVRLLTEHSTTFAGGILVTTAALAKGLEFDEVIVPFATAGNYQTSLDRSTLYVACTRAMHRLSLTHTGPATAFRSPVD
ncbi:MAG TPA: ATP-binding domain-containing protein [Cytophagales bacterium]